MHPLLIYFRCLLKIFLQNTKDMGRIQKMTKGCSGFLNIFKGGNRYILFYSFVIFCIHKKFLRMRFGITERIGLQQADLFLYVII